MKLKLTNTLISVFLASSSPLAVLGEAESKLIRGRSLQDDTTPPSVQSFSPDSGTYITDGASAYTFSVTIIDESPIRNVQFQLRDPDGNVGNFHDGQLEVVGGSGAEEWKSPEMNLGGAFGNWSWRARIVDDSSNRNSFTMPWTDVYVLGDGSAETIMGMIRTEIEALADSNTDLRPKFLRLGFHDCVGTCDGCIDLLDPDNAGLDVPINALIPIVNKYAHNEGLTAAIGSPISRADIWALATLVGVDQATGSQRPDGVTFPMTHFGRVDCSNSVDGYGGPARSLPSPDLTTHGLISFFEDNFGFTSR